MGATILKMISLWQRSFFTDQLHNPFRLFTVQEVCNYPVKFKPVFIALWVPQDQSGYICGYYVMNGKQVIVVQGEL